MPVTKEGIQEFLNYWLYGVLKSASELGNEKVFIRKVQEESIRRFFAAERVRMARVRNPEEAIRMYLRILDGRGIMDEKDVVSRKDGDRVRLEIGPLCPYRATCSWVHEERKPVVCFRAIAFAEALRRLTGHDYAGTLESFSLPCKVTMAPSHIEVR